MDDIALNSKQNNRILLARNAPVGLICGAASFFGSHLVEKLLDKDIQVIGVDDLNFGKRENLSGATENKNFHLLINSPDDLSLEIERLDYIFIVPQRGQSFKGVLDLFKKFKCRLLLISSVELYKDDAKGLKWLKETESEIAKYSRQHNLNARVLRLGAVFGPRMNFNSFLGSDPLIKLIQQSLTGNLQKETSLDFSSRALYIEDACALAVKCIFAGATAQKIFDGVLDNPIKVSDVKQVLLDPLWYETRSFTPTPLPPWPTPNLEKTIKFLNWHPHSHLVRSLRETINYFKDNEIEVPNFEDVEERVEEKRVWSQEKVGEMEKFKKGEKGEEQKKGREEVKKNKGQKNIFPKISFLIFVLLVSYALIWPIFQVGFGVLMFRYQLSQALNHLEKGEFDKSLGSISQARTGVEMANGVFYSLTPIKKFNILNNQFKTGESLANLATQSLDSAQNTILGVQSLFLSLKGITGETNDSPKTYFDRSNTYFAASDEELSKTQALINSEGFKSNLPQILKPSLSSLADKINTYSNLVKKGRAVSLLLPELVGVEGKKEYLVLLQNNNELRPTGGFIGSFATVSFEGGKFKDLKVNDVYAIDGALQIHVEPPKEIKEDLGQKDYFLRDANFDPDFPTSARQIEWFFNKETGQKVDGVVALDISAMENLLSVVGSLNLPDYKEQITSQNLFEKAISYSEVNFFPGTQAKKSFMTALATALFNKLFFVPNQNWPGIVTSLGHSLEHKHMSIYLDNPKLFSYVISQNWGGVMPRGSEKGEESDFLAPVEANLGADKANYYLDRSYNLETMVGKDGEISHRLRVSYTNRSPSEAFPAGKYKNRMRVYLPFGTKLGRALWGESDITKDVSTFSEYGRTGYSFLIELLPKEQKTLVLDYQTPLKLNFMDKKATYKLDILKQAGTLKDPFVWNVTYPINMRVAQESVAKLAPQQYSIKTDLSTDKTFKLEFTRP